MPLLVTPSQFRQRADFYLQLSQLTAAGLVLTRSLDQLQRNPPAASYREPIRQTLAHITEGYTLNESLRRLGNWLPAFDLALLRAGEESGRLDACFRLLADYYQDRAHLARQLLMDSAYPAFLLHMAVFVFAFVRFFRTGDWLVFLAQTFGVLIVLYAIVGVVIYAAQSGHSERWRAWLEGCLHQVPLLGTARQYLALARLSAALEALLSAGVNIIEAWELAATASGSPAYGRVVRAWRPLIEAGQTPAETVLATRRFPEMFASQYSTGEISGQLDDTLRRLHRYYQEEGSRKMHALAQWLPRAVYLAIMLLIAYRVVRFWADYFDQVKAAGGF